MNKKVLKRLCVSAIFIALATVLSMVRIYRMPLGGSVTLFSMLPICLLAIMYGTGWGMASASIYAVIQMLLSIGDVVSWGLTPAALIGTIFFDYLIAYAVLGVSGVFRKGKTGGAVGGISLALCLRFFSHFLSGVIVFANLEAFSVFKREFINQPVLYSIFYNGFFMLPELALTVIGAVLLIKTGVVRYLLKKAE